MPAGGLNLVVCAVPGAQVALHRLRNINNATWDNMYPEYQVWLQARHDMQQQQQQQQVEGQGAATMQ